jgi:prepilin-type processing-associated H-X9-DG protein
MHNYADANKAFPNGCLMVINNAANYPTHIRPWSVAILPYLEQAGIAGQYNIGLPADASTAFWHWSGIAAVASNAALGGTVISTYICPSAPGGESRTVTASITANDMAVLGGTAGQLAALYAGGTLSFPMAPMDYCSFHGVGGPNNSGRFGDVAWPPGNPYRPSSGDQYGALPVAIFNNYPPLGGAGQMALTAGLADITDGTSNTMLLAERVGGPYMYTKGGAVLDLSPVGLTPAKFAALNGGGWINPFNGIGTLYGSAWVVTLANFASSGPCGINCTNMTYKNMYSFHPGGVNMLLADGSVRFIGENTDPFIIGSLFTRSNREPVAAP